MRTEKRHSPKKWTKESLAQLQKLCGTPDLEWRDVGNKLGCTAAQAQSAALNRGWRLIKASKGGMNKLPPEKSEYKATGEFNHASGAAVFYGQPEHISKPLARVMQKIGQGVCNGK